jgi:hypothetical protein
MVASKASGKVTPPLEEEDECEWEQQDRHDCRRGSDNGEGSTMVVLVFWQAAGVAKQRRSVWKGRNRREMQRGV